MKLKKDIIERLLRLSKKYAPGNDLLNKVVIKDNRLYWSNGYCLLTHQYPYDCDCVFYLENNKIKSKPYGNSLVVNYDSVLPKIEQYQYFTDINNDSLDITVVIARCAIEKKFSVDYKKIKGIFSLIANKKLDVYTIKPQYNTKPQPIILTSEGGQINNYFVLTECR